MTTLIATTPAAEIITAWFAGAAVLLGAIGTFVAANQTRRSKRTAAVAADVAATVGTKNGRGDVVTMLKDLQDDVRAVRSDLTERSNLADHRQIEHEKRVHERFEGLHRAITGGLHEVTTRVDHLEHTDQEHP